MERLAYIPEEEIWLAKQKSVCTRRADKLDVRHFIATIAITETAELRQVDHRAVIAWERQMREVEKAAPSTIRRRMSALSSLFKHLVCHGHAAKNPVSEIDRADRVPLRGVATTLLSRVSCSIRRPGAAG
jgi:site-specific recombinase XerD